MLKWIIIPFVSYFVFLTISLIYRQFLDKESINIKENIIWSAVFAVVIVVVECIGALIYLIVHRS
jgi:hypothetical protein